MEWIELGFAAGGFGHFLADVFPEVSEDGHFRAGDIFIDGDAGEFDDPAFDGIHQRKVADGPAEEGAFGVAGATEEEGGGREIVDALDAEFSLDGFQTADPESGVFVVAVGLFAIVAGEWCVIGFGWLFAVAVVGFIVHHDDAF